MAADFGDKTLRQYEMVEEVGRGRYECRLQGLPGCLERCVVPSATVCPCEGRVVSQ